MSDTLAVVNKPTFEWYDQSIGPLRPGDGPLKWDDYSSEHPLLDRYLEDGDRLFLVTVRPGGHLWLVAVYEDVERHEGGWFGRFPNRTRIVDLTPQMAKLRFHTGKGLLQVPTEKLGNSLQNPRLLTLGDIDMLDAQIKRSGQSVRPSRRPAIELEGLEGKRVRYEIERYKRDPAISLARLQQDNYTCQHCGFKAGGVWFRKHPESLSRVLNVHHVNPLADTGETKTKLSDLVTLCPTCHAVVHALARATGKTKGLGAAFLAKYFRKARPPQK